MFSLRKSALNLSFTKLRKGIKGCICHTQVSFRYVRLGNMVKLSFQVLPSSNHCVPKREGIVRLEFYHEARLSWRLTNVLLTHHGLKLCSMMSMSAMPFLPLNIRMKHWIESLFWMRRHGAIGNTDQPTLYTLCGFGIDSNLTGLSPALFKEPPSSDAHVDWPLTGFCQLLHCTLASSCDRPAVYAKAKADFSNQWGHRY